MTGLHYMYLYYILVTDLCRPSLDCDMVIQKYALLPWPPAGNIVGALYHKL